MDKELPVKMCTQARKTKAKIEREDENDNNLIAENMVLLREKELERQGLRLEE